MPLAREGLREMCVATLVLGAGVVGATFVWWPLASPFVVVWVWVLCFFRDPRRKGCFAAGELCAPADGTVTEITELEHFGPLDGPAVRIGVFLSLFNVHINRAPCAGVVRKVSYRKGEFLDARHPESGARNESNTLLMDTDAPMPGPVLVRQVSGMVARRIICHVGVGDRVSTGERFGLIKFGSRTELIIPRLEETELSVCVGDKIRAGVTLMARQPLSPRAVNAEVLQAAVAGA